MLLVNINYILYKLTTSRVFIIKSAHENGEILLANNTISFLLSKFEKNKLDAKKKGFDFLHTFETMLYKDEQYVSVLKSYPALVTQTLKYDLFMPNLISLLDKNSEKHELKKALVLKRTPSGFMINCFGLNNYISFFTFFNNLHKKWNFKSGKKFTNHKLIIKLMLCWLKIKMIKEVNFVFLSLKREQKQLKKKKKILKQTKIKPTLLYTLKK